MENKLKIGNQELLRLLNKLNACDESIEWLQDHNSEQMWNDCPRGDWMLWLLNNLNLDKRTLTLCKGKCAETVKHLMKDERSRNAVEVAIKYGNGESTEEELSAAAYAAAYADASAASAYADAYAYAYAAASAASADAAAFDASAASAYADAYAYASAFDASAKEENQQQTANIVRRIVSHKQLLQLINEHGK